MASKHSTRKNTSSPNQPPLHELKDSVSNKPLEFPTFNFLGRYSPHILSQSTHDPTYTSSPKTLYPNPYSSLNEEILGVTLEELVCHIPNNEFDHLCCHTRAYLQSIGQIPIIYQITRSHASHRRTQPYGEDETLTSTIDDLIITTISEIGQPIEAIAHSETKVCPKFQNLLEDLEGDSTFYDFTEAQVGGSRPPELPEIKLPCTNPPSPIPNFNFLANMATNGPWLVADSIAIPSAQHPLPKHPEKLLPKFDPDNDVTPEGHIKQLMLSLRLIDVQHEDVVCRFFPYSLFGKASTWSFSLIMGSIASRKQFKTTFLTQFRDDKTSGVIFLYLSRIKFDKRDKVRYCNQRFVNILNRIPDRPAKSIQVEFYNATLPPPFSMFVKGKEKRTLEENFLEAIKVEKDLESISSHQGNEENNPSSSEKSIKKKKIISKSDSEKKDKEPTYMESLQRVIK